VARRPILVECDAIPANMIAIAWATLVELRPRANLVLENLVIRQQLAVPRRTKARPFPCGPRIGPDWILAKTERSSGYSHHLPMALSRFVMSSSCCSRTCGLFWLHHLTTIDASNVRLPELVVSARAIGFEPWQATFCKYAMSLVIRR
jgi:hypothetical protein